MPDRPAEGAGAHHGPAIGARPHPAERHEQTHGDGAQRRRVEKRGFRPVEIGDLAGQDVVEADGNGRAQHQERRRMHDAGARPQDHENAAKADPDQAPAPEIEAFAQHWHRERRDQKRHHEQNRNRLGKLQVLQAGKHADRPQKVHERPQDLCSRPGRPHHAEAMAGHEENQREDHVAKQPGPDHLGHRHHLASELGEEIDGREGAHRREHDEDAREDVRLGSRLRRPHGLPPPVMGAKTAIGLATPRNRWVPIAIHLRRSARAKASLTRTGSPRVLVSV